MFNTPVRNHPTYILEKIGSYILLILLVFGNIMTAGTQNMADLFRIAYWKSVLSQLLSGNFQVLLSAAGVVIVLFVVIIISILRWRKTTFHIEGELLFSERKTLIRKLSKLPVASITTVNVEQNVFEKAVGTAKVKIDINSAVTASKTDFIFILKKEQALQFKDTLLSLRDANKEQVEMPARTLLASFSLKDAVRHKLLSVPFVQILTAVTVFVPMFVGESALELHEALTALAVSAMMYSVSLVFGVLNLANFRLETDGKNIYISHGMLKSQNYAFEKSRVKAVFIRQSLLARMFGLCSAELAVVGLGNEKNESPRLCLLINKQQAEQLIAELLPAYTTKTEPTVSSKAALIPAFLLTLLCAAVCAVSIVFIGVYGKILTAVVLAYGILAGVLSQKTRTVNVEEDLFCCSSGILNKKTGRFLYADLQEVRQHTNILMQSKKIGRIGFSILSAKNTNMHKTGWFGTDVYEKLCAKVLAAPDNDIF